MTANELAVKLNNLQYQSDDIEDFHNVAKDNNLIIVFGASDDLMEFRGAIYDEVGCYGGGIAYIQDGVLLQNKCDNDACPYFETEKQISTKIEAVWNQEGYSWIYKTEIPHKTFDILEDEEKYCRGIVFSLADL